jgi:hypothetical protein
MRPFTNWQCILEAEFLFLEDVSIKVWIVGTVLCRLVGWRRFTSQAGGFLQVDIAVVLGKCFFFLEWSSQRGAYEFMQVDQNNWITPPTIFSVLGQLLWKAQEKWNQSIDQRCDLIWRTNLYNNVNSQLCEQAVVNREFTQYSPAWDIYLC